MAKPKLTLFCDVISPFGYVAYYLTRHSPVFKQCDVTYVPVFLGGIMKACNNRPPLEIKNKDQWMVKERLRYRKVFNVPMTETMPDPFPQPTLNTQRTLAAIEMMHAEKLPEALDVLFHAFWVESQTIGKPEVFGPVLEKVFGKEETAKILEKGKSAEAKKQLSDNGDNAMASGAFGLPYFIATNAQGDMEVFWGVDHMGQVVEHLGLDRKSESGLRAML